MAVTEPSGGTPIVRVVVVDDDPLVRAGLRMILGADPTLAVVAEADDGAAALDVVAREAPDVVLMDIRMPGTDGLVATRRLRDRADAARVIVLTTFDADDMVLAALRSGAAGFLLKDTPPAELISAVRRAAAGEPTLSPSVTAQLIATVTTPRDDGRLRAAQRRLAGLTTREHAVAIGVGRGLSNADIAAELHLGLATVKTHVGQVFAKLDATNRVQVARCGHDAGLD